MLFTYAQVNVQMDYKIAHSDAEYRSDVASFIHAYNSELFDDKLRFYYSPQFYLTAVLFFSRAVRASECVGVM